jgi:hypothetical protein
VHKIQAKNLCNFTKGELGPQRRLRTGGYLFRGKRKEGVSPLYLALDCRKLTGIDVIFELFLIAHLHYVIGKCRKLFTKGGNVFSCGGTI